MSAPAPARTPRFARAPVVVRAHRPGTDVRPFLDAGEHVFRDDPAWIPPLRWELARRLHPRHNPFFARGEATLFTAVRDGALVGRCSASIDHEHLRTWRDATGFFGFLDTIDDPDVVRALLGAAGAWLRARGMRRMIGPLSLYVNEEVGVLVDGFDDPPVLGMAHSRRWQAPLCEEVGLAKEQDLFAWRYRDTTGIAPRAIRAWERVRALPGVRFRPLDVRDRGAVQAAFLAIYNGAWAGKWGFVPARADEVAKVLDDLAPFHDPDLAFFVDVDDRPVAMCIMVPNLNEALADLGGRLGPLAVLRLLWRVKVRRPASARLMLLGIHPDARRHLKRLGGLATALYVEVARRAIANGYRWAELSFTREDDTPINLGIRAMGAEPYKRYRVYRAPLA